MKNSGFKVLLLGMALSFLIFSFLSCSPDGDGDSDGDQSTGLTDPYLGQSFTLPSGTIVDWGCKRPHYFIIGARSIFCRMNKDLFGFPEVA